MRDGELGTPVVEIIPTFAVADPQLSESLNFSNLVCACTCVPRRDFELVFNANDLTAGAVIDSLADFEFFTDFGEAFQYSNQMVAIGGYVAAAAAGGEYGKLYDAYESAMQERVLDPTGMADTTLDFDEVQAGGNFATPHGLDLGFDYSPIPMDVESFVTPIAPAGYIIYDAPMTGATMELVEGEEGNPTIILGAGVVEYGFEQ